MAQGNDDEDLPEDLLALKRGLESQGLSAQSPKPGARWSDAEPIDLRGDSASDIVILLRGKSLADEANANSPRRRGLSDETREGSDLRS